MIRRVGDSPGMVLGFYFSIVVNEVTHQINLLLLFTYERHNFLVTRLISHFSVSYEMNDRKKLFQHVFERIMIRFSCRP